MTEEVLLGIDYGQSRIGLAFGRNELVTPLRVIPAKDWSTAISEIATLALHNDVSKIVIGLPLHDDGTETPLAKEVKRFGKTLRIKLGKPVAYIDEYGSSKKAVSGMLTMGTSRKRRRTKDAFSAAVILKNYYHGQ